MLRKTLILVTLLIVVSGIGFGSWLYLNSESPVPSTISKSVSFPVYYPESKKLPQGYSLDKGSFNSPEQGVVVYSINYDDAKKLSISVQEKPEDSKIEEFYSNYIPLRNKIQTELGEAEIGAYGPENNVKTVASLVANNRSWIIITAPYDIDQDQLKQVLNSLRK